MAGDSYILEAAGLSKEFRGFLAVNDVDLKIRAGAIHALIGPNGAGKTTCFNLLTKFVTPSRGQIRFDGVDVTRDAPAAIARRGLVRSFQISATFPHLTVHENVRIALQRRHGLSLQFWRSDSCLAALDPETAALIESVNLGAYAKVPAVELPYGRKRALELAVTLALDPKMMLLDEPMAGMGHEDIQRVIELIRKAAIGRTILMVEHNLSVVSQLCDRITVLQRGEIIAEGSYTEVSADIRVKQAYLGDAA